MSSAALLLALLALLLPGRADAQAGPRVVSTGVFACPTADRWLAQRDLARAGKPDAWIALLEKADCVKIPAGVPLRVAETRTARKLQLACVRAEEGADPCLWTGSDGLRILRP